VSLPEPPWLAVSQAFYENAIYDADLQPWQRVHAAAMARCGANMHAPFAPRELAKLLGKNSPEGFKPMSAQQLSNAIAKAKAKGYLHAASQARCLRLPDSFGTNLAASGAPCPTCTGKTSKPRRTRAKSVPKPAGQGYKISGVRESEKGREDLRRSARRILPKVHSHSELVSLPQ
jgi:hypothetical protein